MVIFNAIFNIYFIQKEKSNLEIINDQINPVNVNLNQLQFLIVRSKMYATNWVYLQAEEESKRNLNKLISEDYPNLKNALIAQFNFSKVFFQKATQDSINHIFNSCEVLFHYQRLIMGKLQDFSDYNNPTKKFESEELIESEVLPRAKILQDLVNRFVIFNRSVSVNYIKEIKNDSDKIMQILFLMSFLIMLNNILTN